MICFQRAVQVCVQLIKREMRFRNGTVVYEEDADERLLPIPMQFDPSSVVYSMQGISMFLQATTVLKFPNYQHQGIQKIPNGPDSFAIETVNQFGYINFAAQTWLNTILNS